MARAFARRGCPVLLTARRADALDAVAGDIRRGGGRAAVYAVDLADADAPLRLAEAAAREGLVVDYLVNNAGFGVAEAFVETDASRLESMVRVNVGALTALTRAFLPGFVDRRAGGEINVASVAGDYPGPGMAVYNASKAYVVSLTLALRRETAGAAVRIGVVCPGGTVTAFHERAGLRPSGLTSWFMMDADTVAEIALQGFEKNRAVIVPGVVNRGLVAVRRFLPDGLAARGYGAAVKRMGA